MALVNGMLHFVAFASLFLAYHKTKISYTRGRHYGTNCKRVLMSEQEKENCILKNAHENQCLPLIVSHVDTKSIVSKSGISGQAYAINPYVGCQHACKYCYFHADFRIIRRNVFYSNIMMI